MTDLGKAREEYKHALRSTYVSRDADECGRTYGLVDEDKADTLIATLEAEVETLKCCGNCVNYCRIPMTARYYCAEGKRDAETGHSMTPWSKCLFTPSRWQEREA